MDETKNVTHPQKENKTFVVLPLADLYPEGAHPKTGIAWGELRRTLLGGRSAQDSGIKLHCQVLELPLGDKARQALKT